MDMRDAVANYLARVGITEAELARRAGISQPSVSRARLKAGTRQGEAKRRLFTYIRQQEAGELPPTLSKAIASTWDRTGEHAEALAALISTSGQLWPGLRDATDDDKG